MQVKNNAEYELNVYIVEVRDDSLQKIVKNLKTIITKVRGQDGN